ncbi:MAG: helix-turn-helix domain-containing protein [Propionivibrio sp.]|nr:helix-turn-helix domain-containing protein [Propionivibrio sp.]
MNVNTPPRFTALKLTVDIFKMDKLMSQKEVKRAQVLDLLKGNKISRQEASKRMGIGAHQLRRLAEHYHAEGTGGLVSKKRGRASSRRLDELCAPRRSSSWSGRVTGTPRRVARCALIRCERVAPGLAK